MSFPVVTVATGGLPVVDTTAANAGLPVNEAVNGYGVAVTKVSNGIGLAVQYRAVVALSQK
jgi:hypothetical protein